MKKIIIAFLIGLLFNNCVVQKTIGNGAYSDLSLNVNDDNYDIKRLATINASGRAFWGIPENVDKKKGIVFRFNGIEIPRTGQFIPSLTMLGYTITIGSFINSLIDNRPSSFLIALPIAGALNNLTYPQAASSVASMNLNRKLIQQNPDIDVFLNPKYDISFNNGFWTQKALIIGNVIGARLIIKDSDAKPNTILETNNKKITKASTEKNIDAKSKKKPDIKTKINKEKKDPLLLLVMKEFEDYKIGEKLKKNNFIIFESENKYFKAKLKYSTKNSNGSYITKEVSIFNEEIKMWTSYDKSIDVYPSMIKGYKE